MRAMKLTWRIYKALIEEGKEKKSMRKGECVEKRFAIVFGE